ncbi:MAG: hypothetical protein FWF59_12455 [Turicibacter sp.]|nr:hypothetical protein [Turicibacter sp.]
MTQKPTHTASGLLTQSPYAARRLPLTQEAAYQNELPGVLSLTQKVAPKHFVGDGKDQYALKIKTLHCPGLAR